MDQSQSDQSNASGTNVQVIADSPVSVTAGQTGQVGQFGQTGQAEQADKAQPAGQADQFGQVQPASQDSNLAPLDFTNAYPSKVAPTYNSSAVVTDNDTSIIPKESVGFGQVEEPVSSESAPVESAPSESTPVESAPSEPTPLHQSPVEQTSDNTQPSLANTKDESAQVDGSKAGGANDGANKDGEKSPLEILEEILAEANSEKTKQTEEEQQKLQKEQEEAKFKAELAAKEAAYRQEASVQMEKTKLDLESAKQQRDQVQEDLTAQGKVSEQTPDVRDETLAIHQLEHDKVQQTT